MQVKTGFAAVVFVLLTVFALPGAAFAAERPPFRSYVACGMVKEAKPSRSCPRASEKGAFFRSNKRAVFYSVCVRFPTNRVLCAKRQRAVKGELYVNSITSKMIGKHRVTWYVRGRPVGTVSFNVTA